MHARSRADRPRARRSIAAFVLLAASLASAPAGCGDDGSSATEGGGSTGAPDNPNPHVTLAATVDVFELCGPIGSKHLSLRATRINCENSPPAPCTLPKDPYETFFGDTRDCEKPTETSTKMYLDVEVSGRYLIEVVTITESGEIGACYGIDGAVESLITSEQLEARETITLSNLGGGPCPGP